MKYIAMFLPQFHEDAHNNKWWGKGFTEWVNVKNARPLFVGHQQPRLPRDGYYDLNCISTLRDQVSESRNYGIDAFSIYHYWSLGKRPLGKIADLILKSPDLDIEYSLTWANHPWTRAWRNRTGSLDLLFDQGYEETASEMSVHFDYLARHFLDKRYTNVNGRPLFQIYRPEDIPNLELYIASLRKYFEEEHSIFIHIVGMVNNYRQDFGYLSLFDSITFFNPTLALFSPDNVLRKDVGRGAVSLQSYIRTAPLPVRSILYRIQDLLPSKVRFMDYKKFWEKLITQYENAINSGHMVNPMAVIDFDNTPRYKSRGRLFKNYNIQLFRNGLSCISGLARQSRGVEAIVFLNAWNEWGEGMYLQADSTYGDERLVAVRDCKAQIKCQ